MCKGDLTAMQINWDMYARRKYSVVFDPFLLIIYKKGRLKKLCKRKGKANPLTGREGP
jgi:hypothetical protein